MTKLKNDEDFFKNSIRNGSKMEFWLFAGYSGGWLYATVITVCNEIMDAKKGEMVGLVLKLGCCVYLHANSSNHFSHTNTLKKVTNG